MGIIIIILFIFILFAISEKVVKEKFSLGEKNTLLLSKEEKPWSKKKQEVYDNVSSINRGTTQIKRGLNQQIDKRQTSDSTVPDYWDPCDVCDTLGDGPTPSECRTLNGTFGSQGTFTKMLLEEIPNTVANIGGFFSNAASFK